MSKNEAQAGQQPKEGAIGWLLSCIIAAIIVVITVTCKYGSKGLVWGAKSLFTKTPVVFRGIGRATTYTAKKMKVTPRAPVALPTPAIFQNCTNLAPARQFDLKQLRKVR